MCEHEKSGTVKNHAILIYFYAISVTFFKNYIENTLLTDPPTFAEAIGIQRDDKQGIPYIPMYPTFKN